MPPNQFAHLELPLLQEGRANLRGGGSESQETKDNKKHRRVEHSEFLRAKATHLNQYWQRVRAERSSIGAPELPLDIPILLKVDPGLDVEALTKFFDFEIVSEQEDGFVLVASPDLNFTKFLETVEKFENSRAGGASAASIHDLGDSEDQTSRLQRLLSDDLFSSWNDLSETSSYIIDIGIECVGKTKIPVYPAKRRGERANNFSRRLEKFKEDADRAFQEWDDVKSRREVTLESFIESYAGEILKLVDDADATYSLPDSFTARIRINGKGLRDLVLNFPFLFEVSSPEEIDIGTSTISSDDGQITITLTAPDENAPRVCVIDSGIQEGHPLLSHSVITADSKSYLPGATTTDVADYVAPNGHGTRVAGAILFPRGVPREGTHKHLCWIQNARVLDHLCRLSSNIFPPKLIESIVKKFFIDPVKKTRIFNHSITSRRPCPTKHMSAWAATMDDLSFEHDILFVQAAGNIPTDRNDVIQKGILQHLQSNTPYPNFLFTKSSRVANPAQSMHSITVGSVSANTFNDGNRKSFSQFEGDPSSFTRTGLGIWETIKPDVVEYGGDFATDSATSPTFTTPGELCPELIRANNAVGPSISSNDVGTSFAAPKVASIAASLNVELPDEPSLLYRALIAQSARWPSNQGSVSNDLDKLRCFGYGIPSLERATRNSDHRITLYSKGPKKIRAREVQIFRIPIPIEIRTQANDQDILIEVCLSYSAKPRRTRRSTRSYLGVWLDWESSKLNESLSSFKRRVVKNSLETEADGDSIPWMLGKWANKNTIRGARRNTSSLQKDWVIIKAYQLPEDFCIGVMGHPGWDIRPDAFANYSVVVSFEAINRDLEIYNPIKVQVAGLEVEGLEVVT